MVLVAGCVCPICICSLEEKDWAVYSVRATTVCLNKTENEYVQKIIEYCESINQTKWNLTIQTANYPKFNISLEKQLNNGSLVVENYGGNVETGDPSLKMWIITANLSEGKRIYKYTSDAPQIESVVDKMFADFLRITVYANFEERGTDTGIDSQFASFWDRETGVLCGMSSIQQYYDEEENIVLAVKTDVEITETTMWIGSNVPENGQTWIPFLFAISTLVVLVAAAMLLYRRKRKRKYSKSKGL